MSIDKTLAERGSRYGRFADHAKIAQGIQDVMREAPNWHHLDYDMKQSLTTISDKIARILNGDPFYIDNWHDIIGYAKLIEDRINMIDTEEQELFEPITKLPSTDPVTHEMIEEAIRRQQENTILLENSPILRGGPGFNGA